MNDVRQQDGSPAGTSFDALTLPWLRDVARFALSLTRNRADADDLVQDTFLKAFRYWDTFIPGNNPRTWLFTICRHTFLRLRRKHSAVIESDEGDVDAMPSVLGHLSAMQEGFAALFDQIDVRPAIERAVDSLPEPHRSVLILVDMEGQSYSEAAETLGVALGTIRSRLFRARRGVQRALINHAHDMNIGPHQATPRRAMMSAADDIGRRVDGQAIVFPPECEQAIRALWDYLDSALGALKMAVIDDHLARCAPCREHAQFERTLIDRIRGIRRAHDDPGALRVRVLAALHEAGLSRQ